MCAAVVVLSARAEGPGPGRGRVSGDVVWRRRIVRGVAIAPRGKPDCRRNRLRPDRAPGPGLRRLHLGSRHVFDGSCLVLACLDRPDTARRAYLARGRNARHNAGSVQGRLTQVGIGRWWVCRPVERRRSGRDRLARRASASTPWRARRRSGLRCLAVRETGGILESYSGMFPCLRGGRSTVLRRQSRSPRISSRRVSLGSITSSM